MANYHIAVQTNKFHVNSEDDFLELMSRVVVDQGNDIDIEMDMDENGLPIFGFSTTGIILGVDPEDETVGSEDGSYELFIEGLQECVAEDDAIILIDVGISDAMDISATATIITSDDSDYISLHDVATKRALEMIEESSVWSHYYRRH